MILDRAVRRDGQHGFRHEQRHERHDHQIGAQGVEPGRHLRRVERLHLADLDARLAGRLRQGVGRLAVAVGRAVDRHDVLAVLAQRLEHLGSERLLSVDDDPHLMTSGPCRVP